MVVDIRSVRRESLKDQIVRQLIELIVSGRFGTGDCLPPERELAQLFDVSRTALREAVGIVAAKGLLDVRHGSGIFVTPPEQWNSLDPILLLAKGKDSALQELMDARELLEPEIAALAAERATAEDIHQVEDNLRLAQTVEEHMENDIQFHLALARLAQNQVLAIMLNSINVLMHEVRREIFVARDTREQAYFRHRAILEKIKQHDVGGASEAMRLHLREARENYLASLEDRMEREGADRYRVDVTLQVSQTRQDGEE